MNARTILILACVTAAPLAAAAQDPAPSQTQEGPMTIERVSSQFAIAPEYKVTDIHGETGQIVGVSGGRVFDSALFIGAGGYWMVNGSHGTDMGYGGAIVEWRLRPNHLIGYSVRGFAGVGQAARPLNISVPAGAGRRDHDNDEPVLNGRFRYRQDFFIVEPEADFIVNMTRQLHLHVGAGYRATSANTRGVGSLDGATGTIGLQIGW